MRTVLLAVDPGALGGVAVLLPDGKTYAVPFTCESDARDLFEATAEAAETEGDELLVVIEKVGGFVGGRGNPGNAMFNFGRNFGFYLGMCAALRLRTELVPPESPSPTPTPSSSSNGRAETSSATMIDFDEHAVFIAPRAARAPRKLERAALIEAKKAIGAKKRCFSSSTKEPLMTRFLRAASVGEIDAFLRISNPDERAACMNRFLRLPEVKEADLLFSERPPVSADQLLWSARAVVLRDVAKHYPPARTQSENVRFCQEAALVLRRLGI